MCLREARKRACVGTSLAGASTTRINDLSCPYSDRRGSLRIIVEETRLNAFPDSRSLDRARRRARVLLNLFLVLIFFLFLSPSLFFSSFYIPFLSLSLFFFSSFFNKPRVARCEHVLRTDVESRARRSCQTPNKAPARSRYRRLPSFANSTDKIAPLRHRVP